MIKNAITLAVAAVSLTLSLQALAADQEHGADGNHQGAVAKEEAITPQKSCPVMGGKINKDLYVDHDGKRVYVCCKGCVGAVKNDPEKYIKKLEDDGVTVAKLQTSCPVMGGKINKDLYVDHEGKRVYVCCKGCVGAVKNDPEKYIKKLAEKGEVPVTVSEAKKEKTDDHDANSMHGEHHH